MRALVIGCGSIGRRHIGNLLQLGITDVVAVDSSTDRLADMGLAFPTISAVADLDEALRSGPDFAVVATPTSAHVQVALAAARRGCHLFVEKPLGHSRAGIDELLAEVDARSLVTLVGCNMRFHPGLRKVKELLLAGAVGNVVAVRASVGQYLPDWRPKEDYRRGYSANREAGGGIILDAIHEIDYVRWLIGEVESVACFAGHVSGLEIETEDVAAILLRFAGAIGEVHLDYVQRAYDRTCHVIGEEGTIRWDFPAGETRLFTVSTGAWQSFPWDVEWRPNDMYVAEMRHFLACLDGSQTPELDAREGARVLDIALAALESSESACVVSV